jgi:hypothetical protein
LLWVSIARARNRVSIALESRCDTLARIAGYRRCPSNTGISLRRAVRHAAASRQCTAHEGLGWVRELMARLPGGFLVGVSISSRKGPDPQRRQKSLLASSSSRDCPAVAHARPGRRPHGPPRQCTCTRHVHHSYCQLSAEHRMPGTRAPRRNSPSPARRREEGSSSGGRTSTSGGEGDMRLGYGLMLVLRFGAVLLPGYIHPDEFFQG